jgi:hypothetical protein
MKKRTSKSASASRKTSSPSGTLAKMVGTASVQVKNVVGETTAEFTAAIADQVRAMTPEQFKSSLIRSGIVSKDGKLTSKYKR